MRYEKVHVRIDDLDDRFYEVEKHDDLDERLTAFLPSRPSDFYFDGFITRAVLP